MAKKIKRYLTKLQNAVIEDLMVGKSKEQKVLKKHGVRLSLYHKWLRNDLFFKELKLRTESVKRDEVFIFARNTAKVAEKLVGLTDKGKGETARRACMDILGYDSRGKDDRSEVDSEGGDEIAMDDETAGKIIGVLADGGRG